MFAAIVYTTRNHCSDSKPLPDFNKTVDEEDFGTMEAFNSDVKNFRVRFLVAKTADVLVGIVLIVLATLSVLGYIPSTHIAYTIGMGAIGGIMMGGATLEGINYLIEMAIKRCCSSTKEYALDEEDTLLSQMSEINFDGMHDHLSGEDVF